MDSVANSFGSFGAWQVILVVVIVVAVLIFKLKGGNRRLK
jgi:hypothetical protein